MTTAGKPAIITEYVHRRRQLLTSFQEHGWQSRGTDGSDVEQRLLHEGP
jgi:hypothetical protein